MKKNSFPLVLTALVLFAMSGCMSVPDPATIPTGLSIAELNQNGQNAFDQNNYKAAEVYYTLIINRYGTDPAALTAAEFEIAHLRMKNKNWPEAKTRLEAIIARYEETGGVGLTPDYLVLAKNDLARIPTPKIKNPKIK